MQNSPSFDGELAVETRKEIYHKEAKYFFVAYYAV